MDTASLWTDASAVIAGVPRAQLLLVTFLAMVCGWIGTLLLRKRMGIGGLVSRASTIVLAGVLMVVVLQLSSIGSILGYARPSFGAAQTIEGGETRVPLSPDGHFWLDATVNGQKTAFLVDTGATLTAVSADLASRAGLTPRTGAFRIQLQTANGSVAADVTRIEKLQIGNIAATNLDAVIAPSLGQTNVLGMNVLSQLEGWRVEDNTLILKPKPSQTAADADMS